MHKNKEGRRAGILPKWHAGVTGFLQKITRGNRAVQWGKTGREGRFCARSGTCGGQRNLIVNGGKRRTLVCSVSKRVHFVLSPLRVVCCGGRGREVSRGGLEFEADARAPESWHAHSEDPRGVAAGLDLCIGEVFRAQENFGSCAEEAAHAGVCSPE